MSTDALLAATWEYGLNPLDDATYSNGSATICCPQPQQQNAQQTDTPSQQEVDETDDTTRLMDIAPDNYDAALAIEDFMSMSGKVSTQTRICSVKGCKTVISGVVFLGSSLRWQISFMLLLSLIESYGFKMCESCRERYRIYGNTKRAKWKSEREAFEREMTMLRAAEDEKRGEKGLAVCIFLFILSCFLISGCSLSLMISMLFVHGSCQSSTKKLSWVIWRNLAQKTSAHFPQSAAYHSKVRQPVGSSKRQLYALITRTPSLSIRK